MKHLAPFMLTPAQKAALKWLEDRGGDAAFDKNGVALAHGENAPVTRRTWNNLAAVGMVEIYNTSGKGRGRIRVVKQ